MPPCYSGPIPVSDEERQVIWRWAKANGIDHGLPIDKVGDAINAHFFNGVGKPEWITDILSGRKTPYRELSTAAWKAQYNRRVIVSQAKDISGQQAMHPVLRGIKKIWDFPRTAAVFGHGVVFPVTHAGDLVLRPSSWGVFMKGFLNTYEKSFNFKGGDAAVARMMDGIKRQPLYDTALRSGLDLNERISDIAGTSKMSGRAWSALTAMRFELWNRAMQKFANRPQAEVLDIGKNLAEWANHATGSGKGPISKLGGGFLFGPKLTQSKLNRLLVDPVKTAGTFANWNNATPGEKAVALRRLSGLGQYVGTGLGLLAVNQGVLWATGQKDKDGKPLKINLTDPFKGDFLAFKSGGLEWSLPGMHSEFKELGKLLAISFENSKEINKIYRTKSKFDQATTELKNYALSKAVPAVGVIREAMTARDFLGRPLPWSPEKGTPSKPRIGWTEYLLSHGPIPLQGPIRYVYDQLRAKGSSAMDAMGIIKGLIITGVGATGMHIGVDYPDYGAAKAAAKRGVVAQKLMAH
jgi:hypothetical protein